MRTRADLGAQSLADVAVRSDAKVLGSATEHSELTDQWRVLMASALVGLAEAALVLGTAYVTERRQFGVPIGSFQALQHGLADLPGMVEGARLLVGKAAWARDARPDQVVDLATNDVSDARALAVMALLFASETASLVTDRVLHYHGGYGCADEFDIQLYYRRARSWPMAIGPRRSERRLLADLLLPPTPTGAAA
jgi:alkylation response protein AidB-like acyl-CoA dehydrogenase